MRARTPRGAERNPLGEVKPLLAQHDLTYECAAAEWLDGLPIANGEIGAVIWGDGAPLIFTLDSYGVWETRAPWPGDDPRFNYANLRRLKEEGRREELVEVALRRRNMRFDVTGNRNPPPFPTRLSTGRMELRWPKACGGFSGRLDLFRACASGRLEFARGKARVSSFVCSTRDVLVVQIRCEGGLPLPRVALAPAPVDEFSRVHFEAWKYPAPELFHEGDRHVLFRRYSEGKEYSVVAEEQRGHGTLTIFLTIVAGKEGDHTQDKAISLLAEARHRGVAALRKEHEADWAKFWEKSAIILPDSRLENFYYVEMYKHNCSSRPGHLPVTLQGVWTTDGAWPPWRGSYTTDLNVQFSYWPIYTSNHLECGEPLYEMYWRNLPYHKKIGSYWYGKEIAVITSEHGPGGEPFPGYFTEEHSPGAGAWIAHNYWLHWLYSGDKTFLRERAYPFLREMVQAYLHIAEKRKDGKYHIPFTDSPEFYCGQPESMGDDGNYDLALLRFLLCSLLEAQQHLAEPDPQCNRWKDLLGNLVDYPTTPAGFFLYCSRAHPPNLPPLDPSDHMCLAMRAGEPLPHTHRHHSHVIGVHPLGVIDPERSPTERRLVENTLEDLVFKGTGEWSGMSFPWASMIAGRAGHAWMAYSYLQRYLDAFVAPNSFHINGDPWRKGVTAHAMKAMTLESGFAAAAAILELLLQSHHGLIRVFPTCPPIWRDVAFVNLRAEGAFLVSARKRGHEVRFMEILSEVGGVCRVRNPFAGACTLTHLATGKTRVLRGQVLEFSTGPGGCYRLTPPGARLAERDGTLIPARRPARERNWFGTKRHPKF